MNDPWSYVTGVAWCAGLAWALSRPGQHDRPQPQAQPQPQQRTEAPVTVVVEPPQPGRAIES